MKYVPSVLSLIAFVVTWLLVRRLLGETTFTVGNAVAMGGAALSTLVTMQWLQKRKARLAS